MVILLLDEPVAEQLRRPARRVVREEHRRARGQMRPDLPHRGVEADAGDLARPVARADAERRDVPVDEVGQVRVGQLDALGPTRAARGVDDVGQVARIRRRERGGVRVPPLRPWSVDDERTPGPLGQPWLVMRGRHDRRDVRVGEDEPDAITGAGGVDREVGRTRPEDSARRDHELGRAVQEHPDTGSWGDLRRTEPGREAARPPHELGIGQRACRVGDGDAVRIDRRAGSDQGADGSERRIGARQVRVVERVDRREIRRHGSPNN